MTDRREGFPPTPASSSTPLHDGSSVFCRDCRFAKRSFFGDILMGFGWRYAKCTAPQAGFKYGGGGRLVTGKEQLDGRWFCSTMRDFGCGREGKWFEPRRAAPSYGPSSEGTRAGGQQPPTQNEGE